jgi:preprotein translocase subunit SecD
MTICGLHGKRHLHFHTVLVFTVLAANFSTALTAAGLSGNQPGKHTFELRLASHEKMEGWKMVPGPGPEKTPVWLSPEVALTKSDIARAWPQPSADEFVVGFMLTEEGALKLARLTKSHIGENVAIIWDGQVISVSRITAEITGGQAIIHGKYSEEVAGALARELMRK